MPTVSIIAAAHNQAQHIHQSLLAVMHQTFQDFELIVTDDASTDDTLAIISLFAGDSRLKILSNPVQEGLTNALVRAGSVSQGKYIALLNCNDAFERHHLETLIPYLESNKEASGVFGLANEINEDGDSTGVVTDACVKADRFQKLNMLYRNFNPFCISAGLFRRECIIDSGLMISPFSQSHESSMWANLLFKGNLDLIPDAVTRRRREREISTTLLNRRAFERFEFLALYPERINSKELLLKIFPEVEDTGLPVKEDLVHFHLGLISISCEHPSNQLFGLHLLHQQMKEPELVATLKSECGFVYQDLFDLEDTFCVFSEAAGKHALTFEQPLEPIIGSARLRPIDDYKVNYSNILPDMIPLTGILPREGPHPTHGIPFAFNWCSGPACTLKLTCDTAGPHMLVLQAQNLHFPEMRIDILIAGNDLHFEMKHKSGAKTDLLQAIVNLEPGIHTLSIKSDNYQSATANDNRCQAFILRDIRLWECF